MTIDILSLNVKLSSDSLVLEVNSWQQAQRLVRSSTKLFASWASSFGMKATIIKYPGCKRPFRIPATICNYKGFTMVSSLLQTPSGIQVAQMRLSAPLLQVLLEFTENPQMSAGLVRLSDEQQVCVTEASARLIPNNDAEELVTLKRQDYWWLEDLDTFNTEWRLRLEANNPQSFLEYSYRAEIDQLGNWGRLTSRYRLIQDDQGILYHVCYSVGYDTIPRLR